MSLPNSILAPLFVGYTSSNSFDAPKEAVLAFRISGAAVPTAVVRRKVRVNKRDISLEHLRRVRWSDPTAKPLLGILSAKDTVPGQPSLREISLWQMTLELTAWETVSDRPAPPNAHAVRLGVSRFEVRRGLIAAAPQLALARALFVRHLRAVDPSLIVVGGQHEWRPDYWTYADRSEED